MATSTFDKNIVLSAEAAERFAAIFDEPPRVIPDMSDFFRESEEKSQCMLRRLKTSSMQESKKAL